VYLEVRRSARGLMIGKGVCLCRFIEVTQTSVCVVPTRKLKFAPLREYRTLRQSYDSEPDSELCDGARILQHQHLSVFK